MAVLTCRESNKIEKKYGILSEQIVQFKEKYMMFVKFL